MYESVKLLAVNTVKNAFTREPSTLKKRVAFANEITKRTGKVLGHTDQEKLRRVLLDMAESWAS